MKQHLFFGLLILLLLILLPLVSLGGRLRTREAQPEQTQVQVTQPAPQATKAPKAAKKDKDSPSGETIAVMRSASGRTETIGMEEYLVGCLAAEMLASSHEEALKAQAVASYTYARYRLDVAGKEALSDSGASDQGYLSEAQRRERWGKNYEVYEAKVEKAVQAVRGQTITYDGKPIFAAYHSVSGGKTESAGTYWGQDYPCLQSADSPGDKLSPDYTQTVTFTPAEIKTALGKLKGVKLEGDQAKWFGKPVRSEAGTVTEIAVGGAKLTGRQVREALELRSANFEVTYKNGAFQVKTYGYGHGVGMSQYGADFMARQGDSYKEILAHYYPGCEIK